MLHMTKHSLWLEVAIKSCLPSRHKQNQLPRAKIHYLDFDSNRKKTSSPSTNTHNHDGTRQRSEDEINHTVMKGEKTAINERRNFIKLSAPTTYVV